MKLAFRLNVALLFSMVALAACGDLSAGCAGATATRQAVRSLTDSYGAEAKQVVENLELRMFSPEAHRDPNVLPQLLARSYLEHYASDYAGNVMHHTAETMLVASSMSADNIRVYERTDLRLKCATCVTKVVDEIGFDGTLKWGGKPFKICAVYIFLREDGTWKYAGDYNLADRRFWDWDRVDPWLKEIIGELPRDKDLRTGP